MAMARRTVLSGSESQPGATRSRLFLSSLPADAAVRPGFRLQLCALELLDTKTAFAVRRGELQVCAALDAWCGGALSGRRARSAEPRARRISRGRLFAGGPSAERLELRA